MKILYKVTSRSRPENLKRTLLNIREMALNPDYLICLTLDEDDETVNNVEFRDWLNQNFGLELHYFFGHSENKVHAINRDLEHFTNFDILINVSDDQVFTIRGFDTFIEAMFKTHGLDTFLHFRDINHPLPGDSLCTLSIIGREYFNRDGYIYHPSYKSVYCDDEATVVAKQRGCHRFISEPIAEHLHPAYGKAPNDSQYQKTEHRLVHQTDHKNFLKRKKLGFPK